MTKERGIAGLATITSFLVIATFIAGKTARDATLLSHFEVRLLPTFVGISALITIPLVLTVGRRITTKGPAWLFPRMNLSTWKVDIHGFPFLTQVLSGHYGQMDVTVRNFTRNGLTVDRVRVSAHGVSVPLGQVISGNVKEVPVDRADAVVTISLAASDDLATHVRELGGRDVRSAPVGVGA